LLADARLDATLKVISETGIRDIRYHATRYMAGCLKYCEESLFHRLLEHNALQAIQKFLSTDDLDKEDLKACLSCLINLYSRTIG